MVKINIIFDRPDHRYSPGDAIDLQFIVQINSEINFCSIYVRLQGFAHVEWTVTRTVSRNGKSHIERTTYSAHETYFKNYQTLAGSERGPSIRLPAGSHVYRARFILPQHLPESHEGKKGHIRYEAKMHINVPWGFDNKETTLFYVSPLFDLNQFQHLREPVCVEAKKPFGYCCWKSDPLYIYNILPHRGFVPGERVQFILELNNDSDVAINGATVKLVEKIAYRAKHPSTRTREYSRTLWQYDFSVRNSQLVAAMQNKVYSTELYFDPSWGFRFFDACGIITVEYYIMTEARASGCYTNLTNNTLIIMGTIPFGNYPPPNIRMSLPSAPTIEPIVEQPLPSYNDAVTRQ